MLKINSVSGKKPKHRAVALTLIDKLLPALEGKQYAICVFLDYSACFDTLSRSILHDNLERYGTRGVILDFVKTILQTGHNMCTMTQLNHPSDAKN